MAYNFPNIHSLYGRFLGVTPNGYPTSENGWKDRITAATSGTTATTIKAYGINTITVSGTAAYSYTMDPPEPGVSVTLACLYGSSDGKATISQGSSCYIVTGPITLANASTANPVAVTLAAASSGYTTIRMWAAGQVVNLVGLTTAAYLIKSISGFSTSTAAGAAIST